MIGSNLLRYTDSQKYCLWDWESTSLSLGYTQPWQLSYAICSNKGIESITTKYLWWDNLNMGVDAARITRFNYNDYKSRAEDPKKVFDEFNVLIMDERYMLVGHNVLGFDVYLIEILREMFYGKKDYSYIARTLDTNSLMKAYKMGFVKEPNESIISFMYRLNSWWQRGVKTNLSQACRDFQINFDEAKTHDAEYDITINFQVFQKLLWNVEI